VYKFKNENYFLALFYYKAFQKNLQSVYLFVYVSICLCVYVSMCLCVYVSMCLCAYVSMCLCVYVSMRICVYVSMCLCVYASMCLCVYVCMCLCVYGSICLRVYLSICLCVHLSMSLLVSLVSLTRVSTELNLRMDHWVGSPFSFVLMVTRFLSWMTGASFLNHWKNKTVLLIITFDQKSACQTIEKHIF